MACSVVVDASVALKWYLADEDHCPEAAAIANGLRRATNRKDRPIDPGASRLALHDFLALPIRTVEISREIEMVYDEALRLGIRVFDMGYVHVAERFGIEVVTADERLANATRASKPFVRHLSTYAPPTAGSP